VIFHRYSALELRPHQLVLFTVHPREMDRRSHEKDGQFDLSQKWMHVMRQATKDTASISCPLCAEKKVVATQEILWDHILQEHAALVPSQNDDPAAFYSFKEDIKTRAITQVGQR
jgi:hypothetical protein